jgi:acetyltransferase
VAEHLAIPGGIQVGVDDIYDGLFRRAGMLRVSDVAELFDAVETMARSKRLRGDRLAILSNGGGPAIMAKDILYSQGGQLARFSQETMSELQEALPTGFTGSNPIRIMDHSPSEYYASALDIMLRDTNVDAVMVIHVPTAFASSDDIAGAIVNSVGRSRKNVLTVWLGEKYAEQARRMFALAGLPTYETPDQAVRLFMDMVRYRRNQELLMETPDSVPREFSSQPEAARAMVDNALEEGRERLSQSETIEILSTYAIPVVETRIAEDTEEACLIARDLGYPVALKILSPDIRSKKDVGGLALDIETEEDLRKAAQGMLSRVEKIRPNANIQGFIVQKMSRKPDAYELLVGMSTDPDFGPVIIFGQGGAAGRVTKDRAVGIPPLNMTLAKELVQRTHISKLLQGSAGQAGVDVESIKLTLVQLSQLIIDVPEITGITVNPLLADSDGVLALDALIDIAPTQETGEARLAIRPYPDRLEECAKLESGLAVIIRPIRPEDEHSHLEFIGHLSQEDLRMRFFGFVHEFPHSQMAKLTQIDYDREMAFIAKTLEDDEQSKTIGVVRAYFDPDNISAEFAIVVRTDLKVKGLGSALMDKMVRYCRERGTKELTAYTLRENKAMQALGKKFGFTIHSAPDDPETIELKLQIDGESG